MSDEENAPNLQAPAKAPADAPEADATEAEATEEDARLASMLANAIPRLLRLMLAAGFVLLPLAYWMCGWLGAIGFAVGVAISYLNFLALTRGVESLADRIVNRNSQEKGRKIVVRFVVRYALVAVVAYVIFKGSTSAFRGFLWGLCVPVAAMMIEAVLEGFAAFRRN